MSLQTNNYKNILSDLKEKIRQARLKAVLTANANLLAIYWEIGTTILQQQEQEGWGAKIIDTLAIDLKLEFPDFKGLSVRNLKYMRAFAEAYPQFAFVQQPVAQLENTDTQQITIMQQAVAQLPWGHHIVILTKSKTIEERVFYIQKCIENNWSRDVLAMQIETELHKRIGNTLNNFNTTLTEVNSDLANATFKNPYLFDFLSMGEKMKERDLEQALIKHLKKFMLELGKGFAYVGNQYNLNVEGDDYFLDLLFYNTHLHCFVVFELKIGEFKPEFAGKLNFYINTIDEQVKGAEDKPTIGILLCKTPNETVVKYALKGINAPIGVSEYQLANALPKQLKGDMPTIEELENEIETGYSELLKPVDAKLNKLKEMISTLKQPAVKEKRSPENLHTLLTELVFPLRNSIKDKLNTKGLLQQFTDTKITIFIDSHGYETDEEILAYLEKNKWSSLYCISISMDGFKAAGTKAFYISQDVFISASNYNYKISLERNDQKPLFEKLYPQILDSTELEQLTDQVIESIVDNILQNVERIKTQS